MKYIRIVVLIVAVLGVSQCVYAQQYAIKSLKGSIVPVKNAERFMQGDYDENLTSIIGDREIFVLQLNSIPREKEKLALEAEGIVLHHYIGGNAYVASRQISLLKSQMVRPKTSTPNIRAILNIKGINKLSEKLKGDNFPAHIYSGDQNIEVVVSFLNIVNDDFINRFMQDNNLHDYNVDKKYGAIYMTIHPDQLNMLADQPWIIRIEGKSEPVRKQDLQGQILIGAGAGARGIGTSSKYTGKGVTVGVWDGDVESHIDIAGRLNINENGDNESPHGTHVACIVGGRGLIKPIAEGIATDINIESWNYEVQENGLYNYQEMDYAVQNRGITVSQNSYGATGLGGDFPKYHHRNRMLDKVACNYPELTMVFSAGNSRDLSHMMGYDGYRTVCRSAKNGLTVGAVDGQKKICNFSSFGPTHNGRIAPLVCAYGMHVYSGSYSNQYIYFNGTSQATPAVSGAVAQLCQAYRELNGESNPLSALMKAVTCNSAEDLGNKGPDYAYGYGLVSVPKALKVLENSQYFLGSLEHDEGKTYSISVPEGISAVKAMLVWTDPVSDVESETSLINNLDLKIVAGGADYLPWILNPKKEEELAQRGIDLINNIEQVTIENPDPGVVDLVVKGTSIPSGPQSFALVYSFEHEGPEVIYPLGGEMLETDKTATLRWNYKGSSSTVKIELSKDGGSSYELISNNIKASLGYLDYRMPKIPSKMKIRVSADGRKSESGIFTTLAKPESLSYIFTSPSTAKLTWSTVDNVTGYEVLKVGDGNIEVVAKVTQASCMLSELKSSDDNWFTVRTVNDQFGITGPRCDAIEVNPVKATTTIPIVEDFEDGNPLYFSVKRGSKLSSYFDFDNFIPGNRYCLIEGSDKEELWQASDDEQALWTNNLDFQYVLQTGTIEADKFEDVLLSFDLGQLGGKDLLSNSVRVCVNGNPIADVQGDIYHKPVEFSEMKIRRKYYNLNAYLNQPMVVSIQVLCRHKRVSDEHGDVTIIDNITLEERKDNNLAILDGAYPKTGTGVGSEELSVDVVNLGKKEVAGFDLAYLIDAGRDNAQLVSETVAESLSPYENYHYTFNTKGDFSDTTEIHTLKFYHNVQGDLEKSNDTLCAADIDNYGHIVLMPVEGKVEITTNDTIFTDPGSQKGYYPPKGEFGVITFRPRDLISVLEVSFEDFKVADPDDHLRIYSGSKAEGEPLATYTGSEIPQTVRSEAKDGSLTFAFSGSMFVYWSGWIARIKAVPKDNLPTNDLGIVSFNQDKIDYSSPVSFGVVIGNYGSESATNFDVCYKIDEETVVREKIDGEIKPGETMEYNFKSEEDVSNYGGKYHVKIFSSLSNDVNNTNDTISTIISRSYPVASGSGDMYIEKVELGDLVNESKSENYGYFIEEEASLNKSNPYDLEVTMAGFYIQPAKLTGWIDWNNDGTFGESEEITFQRTGKRFTANVVPDYNYGVGTKCMRLRLYDGYKIKNPLPEGKYEKGEVEDYTIRLLESDIPTGVSVDGLDPVKLYPNPSSGIVTMDNIADADIRIYNALGSLVWSCKSYNNSKVLNLELLPRGLYVVAVVKENSRVQLKLLLQ
ncbi:T9SS type A sorting domain-containing protein [Puteibacter caeruleilacunae]|nr:T9SS type A sorting domain-containing protein [Puteibacter caeruleilacunae]